MTQTYTIDKSHCFLNNLDPNTKIYKYFPLKYVAEMYRSRKYMINQVKKWEDVYENYFLKQDLVNNNGDPIDTTNVRDSCYGQSWSKLNESDAMWRIYSPNLDSIKVRTSSAKLLDLFCHSVMDTGCTYMANVNYRTQSDIDNEFKLLQDQKMSVSSIGSGALNTYIVESLITKRSEFAHEEEVRLIKQIEASRDTNFPDFLVADFDPKVFFEELIIDPRADDITFKNTRDLLTAVGADPAIIEKSRLYAFNKHTLII